MLRVALVLIAPAAAAGVAWYFFVVRPHREVRRIAKRLDRFEKLASRKHGSGALNVAVRSQSFSGLFTPAVRLDIPDAHLSGQYSAEELASVAARSLLTFRWTSLRFYDRDIRLDAPDHAVVRATARFQAEMRTADRIDEVRELRCELRKQGRTWYFSNIAQVQVLRR